MGMIASRPGVIPVRFKRLKRFVQYFIDRLSCACKSKGVAANSATRFDSRNPQRHTTPFLSCTAFFHLCILRAVCGGLEPAGNLWGRSVNRIWPAFLFDSIKADSFKNLPKGESIMEHLTCIRTATGAFSFSRPGLSRPSSTSIQKFKEVSI